MTKLQDELRERMLGYIITALGLVAGLAWNDAIKAFIEYVIPLGNGTLLLKFVYAMVVTVAIVIAAMNLSRFLKKEE
ncbi:MAG TPA: DUF5654 family protein [Candidatus Paceibacterota bacterium]|nr:DUF5654 family protein [Candidatus Paceibacterota bacterium]